MSTAETLPGNYWPPVLDLLAHPLGHDSTVTAHPVNADPFTLPVTAGSLQVSFSEDWAPFAQVELSLPAADPDLLELLDPRKNCRLSVAAGYIYPDGQRDVLPLADVGLRERPVTRPDDLVRLKAAGDEARAQDYRLMWNAAFPRTGINEAVRWLLGFALAPDKPTLRSDYPDGWQASALDEIDAEPGTDVWSILDDIAARGSVRIWCDEKRVWRIGPRSAWAAESVLDLTVGENGTLIRTDSGLSRETWYNAAVLRYRWKNAAGDDVTRYGRARVTGGEFSVQEVGARVYSEDIDRPVSQAAADAAAASRVKILSTRGRSLELQAGAAYWIRPGDAVRVQLPTGPAEKHLVQSVKFRPHEGLMDLVTRQPQNAQITYGE